MTLMMTTLIVRNLTEGFWLTRSAYGRDYSLVAPRLFSDFSQLYIAETAGFEETKIGLRNEFERCIYRNYTGPIE
jgi:hypothetical protein